MDKSADNSKKSERCVLIVDDEPTVLRMLEKIIAPHYVAFATKNTRDAEEILHRHRVDVILCDHFMADELGLDFIRRIGSEYPETIKIMLTGCSEPATVMDAINQGHVFKYLTKPMTRRAVLDAVEDGLNECDKRRELNDIVERHRSTNEQIAAREKHFSEYEKRCSRYLKLILRFAFLSFGVIAGMLAALAVVGTGMFVFLYAVKSFLGFDTFDYFHLDDLVERFLL